MPSEQQMLITERELTLNNGKVYRLRRPTLAVRRKYLDYMGLVKQFTNRAQEIAELTISDDEQSRQEASEGLAEVRQQTADTLKALVDLLLFWLKITHPDITVEEIWENFDDTDAAKVQVLIQNFEAEIDAAFPPANRAQRRARRTPTGAKSTAVS